MNKFKFWIPIFGLYLWKIKCLHPYKNDDEWTFYFEIYQTFISILLGSTLLILLLLLFL